MVAVASSTTEQDLLAGKLWTVQYTTASLTAGTGFELFGITIGEKDVIYQARTYAGTTTDALVTLYENSWSGGTPTTAGNRNLKILSPGPASYASGVTATPTLARTSIRLFSGAATGSAQLGNVPEGEWYMLSANTQYVLKVANLGIGAGIINFRFTYRAID